MAASNEGGLCSNSAYSSGVSLLDTALWPNHPNFVQKLSDIFAFLRVPHLSRQLLSMFTNMNISWFFLDILNFLDPWEWDSHRVTIGVNFGLWQVSTSCWTSSVDKSWIGIFQTYRDIIITYINLYWDYKKFVYLNSSFAPFQTKKISFIDRLNFLWCRNGQIILGWNL